MSSGNWYNPLSWFGGIFRIPSVLEDAPRPDKKPSLGEETPTQAGPMLAPGVGAGMWPGVGFPGTDGINVAINGATFGFYGSGKGFAQPPRGFYSTYRLMSLNPTLAVVISEMSDKIVANVWNVVKASNDVADEWLKEVESQVLPQRAVVIPEAIRYAVFGWRPFEKVWSVEKGRYKIRLKPLLPDHTSLYTDRAGNFAGLVNHPGIINSFNAGVEDPKDLLSPQYSLILTHDGEAGNVYGLSRMEAAYEPYCDWQMARLDMAKVRGKLAGIIPMLHYSPGSTMLAGQLTDNAVIAQKILTTLTLGNGVALPSMEYDISAIEQNPALAKTSLWSLDFYDAGSYAPAQSGMIEAQGYHDKLLARAWRVRERAVFEAQSGTRADAGSHTDSNIASSERMDNDIATQLNRQWIDEILVSNFGPGARGKVLIKPAPLTNPTVEFKQKLLLALAANPNALAQLVQPNLDERELMKDTELPVLDKAKPVVMPQPASPSGSTQAGTNGNAKPNGSPNGKPTTPGNGQATGSLPNRLAALEKGK